MREIAPAWIRHSLKVPNSVGGTRTPRPNTWFLGLPRVQISIGSVVFAGFTVVSQINKTLNSCP